MVDAAINIKARMSQEQRQVRATNTMADQVAQQQLTMPFPSKGGLDRSASGKPPVGPAHHTEPRQSAQDASRKHDTNDVSTHAGTVRTKYTAKNSQISTSEVGMGLAS